MKESIVFLALLFVYGCSNSSDDNTSPDPLVGSADSEDEEEPLFQASLDDNDEIIVPTTLEEVYAELDRGLSDYARELLAKKREELTEEEGQIMAFSLGHFGFGMWMRNNWGLWGDSDLAKYFNSIGIYHPDDMSGVIFDSYIARLRDESFDLDEQVERYQTYWARASQPDPKVDESTGHTIGIVDSETSYHLESGVIIHVGEDKETKETWYYSRERGWFQPTNEEIEMITGETNGASQRVN